MAGDERKPDEGDDMSISSESNLTGKDSRTSSRLGPSPGIKICRVVITIDLQWYGLMMTFLVMYQ